MFACLRAQIAKYKAGEQFNACSLQEKSNLEAMVIVYHKNIKGPICGGSGPHGPYACKIPDCSESKSKLMEDLVEGFLLPSRIPELDTVRPMTFLEACSGILKIIIEVFS